jgi:hypothetical protein
VEGCQRGESDLLCMTSSSDQLLFFVVEEY